MGDRPGLVVAVEVSAAWVEAHADGLVAVLAVRPVLTVRPYG